jgi:hypothetical protein
MGQGGSKDSRSGSAIHQEQSIPITVQVLAMVVVFAIQVLT